MRSIRITIIISIHCAGIFLCGCVRRPTSALIIDIAASEDWKLSHEVYLELGEEKVKFPVVAIWGESRIKVNYKPLAINIDGKLYTIRVFPEDELFEKGVEGSKYRGSQVIPGKKINFVYTMVLGPKLSSIKYLNLSDDQKASIMKTAVILNTGS